MPVAFYLSLVAAISGRFSMMSMNLSSLRNHQLIYLLKELSLTMETRLILLKKNYQHLHLTILINGMLTGLYILIAQLNVIERIQGQALQEKEKNWPEKLVMMSMSSQLVQPTHFLKNLILLQLLRRKMLTGRSS